MHFVSYETMRRIVSTDKKTSHNIINKKGLPIWKTLDLYIPETVVYFYRDWFI